MNIEELPVVNDPRRAQNVSELADARTRLDVNLVPTADDEVRAFLRRLGEPITYFGENNADRRQRLIAFLQEHPHSVDEHDKSTEAPSNADSDESADEEFYTPGAEQLLAARKLILKYSLARARDRVRQQRRDFDTELVKTLRHRRHINAQLAKYELFGSQLIPNNRRAISTTRYSPDGSAIACASWDGNIYILNSEDLTQTHQATPGYHTEKAVLDWHSDIIVSGGGEGAMNIWRIGEPSSQLVPVTNKTAHESRITKALFHPSGKFAATTSFDQTWKLWDLEKVTELFQQEGHAKEVFGASFHPDGSIFATGGLDGYGKLWDLRSGRLIANLASHIQGIYTMDWSPNGYHIATGSGDCSVKIWDLRRLDTRHSFKDRPELFAIPAHTKMVSDVRFYNNADISTQKLNREVADENDEYPEIISSNGKFLATASYDGTIGLWSTENWIRVGTLAANDKVMALDIHKAGQRIVSSSWDRAVKLWAA